MVSGGGDNASVRLVSQLLSCGYRPNVSFREELISGVDSGESLGV